MYLACVTAAVAGVDQHEFQVRMWRSTPVPLMVCVLLYGVLSFLCPIQRVDAQIVAALEEGFDLSWPTILPAAALLISPG